ncbi:proteasome subunit alpha, partial [Candidatus Borrarchaeum sp.]|uniref:proteasome subunit alpha n=1 Tax=Candidatus Borrarchaeum sp. TaxID=2846742 RepID=UPI0031834821
GVAIAGLTADARVLINQARINAQMHRLTYDEPINVEVLTREIGDLMQVYTQYAGVRPFGVKLLIMGVDDNGTQLFSTDPSGTYFGNLAAVIGAGEQQALELLEKDYQPDLDLDGMILLSLRALEQVIESELDATKVEITVITEDERKLKNLTVEEITNYIKRKT